jgi:hypothetical protein
MTWDSGREGVLLSIERGDEEQLDEIPPDVHKMLEEIDLEEELPDEDTLQVSEHI